MATFTPSPALATATRRALQTFARHKPGIFKLANETSEAAEAFVAEYARALLGVTLDAIPEAAQRWVATKTEIASAASFGMYARAIDVEEFRPPTFLPSPAPVATEAATTKNTARIDVLSTRAIKALSHTAKGPVGCLRLLSEVWSLLEANAQTPDAKAAVRRGDVDDTTFDAAVEAVRTGKRAPAGPLHADVNGAAAASMRTAR